MYQLFKLQLYIILPLEVDCSNYLINSFFFISFSTKYMNVIITYKVKSVGSGLKKIILCKAFFLFRKELNNLLINTRSKPLLYYNHYRQQNLFLNSKNFCFSDLSHLPFDIAWRSRETKQTLF